VPLERALCVGCGGRGVAGAGEDVEEGVALSVDLLAAVAGERLAHEPLVLGEHGGVALAQLLDESGGAVDVGEEKRDGACAGSPLGRWGCRCREVE
jgi:hypothetical protein